MVCGRYPKEIRHYERNLKRKCFAKLKNNVWENKTKLQLMLRADCHYYLRLLSFYFRCWIIFVKHVKKKYSNKNKAEEHYEFKLKKKALKALNEEIGKNCELIRNFRKQSEFNWKRRIFDNWKQYVHCRRKIKIIKNFADNIRGEQLIVNYLYVWAQRLSEKKELERKFERSSLINELFLKRKAFNKLKLYANRRRHKIEMEAFLTNRYGNVLKRKIFTGWKNFVAKKTLHKHFTERIKSFYENYLIKLYLDVWVTRHDDLTEKKLEEKNSKAENLYRKKLLINYFKRMKKLTQRKRTENILAMKFFEFYETEIVKSYLEKWRNALSVKVYYTSLELKAVDFRRDKLIEIYFEAIQIRYGEIKNEEIKLSKAEAHYENNLLSNFFNRWLKFLTTKRGKIEKINEARLYYETRLKGKIFDRFEKFLILNRRKKIGINFYDFNLKLKALKKWKLYHERTKIKNLKTALARRVYSSKIQRKCLKALKTESILKKERMDQAFKFYEKNLKKKIFRNWKKFSDSKVNYKLKMNSVKLTIDNAIVGQYLSIWYEQYEKKLYLNRKIEQMQEDRQLKILKISFTNWRKFFLKKKKIKEAEVVMNDLKPLIIMESYLFKLYELFENRKKDRAKYKLALALEEKLIKRKYFKRWLSFKKWKEAISVDCENKFDYDCVEKDVKRSLEWNQISDSRPERRQPMIPKYLMNRIEVTTEKRKPKKRNDETYTVLSPVNKKLPNVDWGNEEIDLSVNYSFL